MRRLVKRIFKEEKKKESLSGLNSERYTYEIQHEKRENERKDCNIIRRFDSISSVSDWIAGVHRKLYHRIQSIHRVQPRTGKLGGVQCRFTFDFVPPVQEKRSESSDRNERKKNAIYLLQYIFKYSATAK